MTSAPLPRTHIRPVSTSGLLTFTGIFAATVATFLTQSFEQLQPDTASQAVFVGNQTVYLLAQLVSANNPTLAVPNPDISSSPFIFEAPTSAVVLNSLWFLSLVISLVCTLLATLVQEWSRDFQRASSRRFTDKTVKEAAFNHIYQRMGVDRFGLDYMTSIIVGLIHVSVALFLVGLAIYLVPIHRVPALVVIISSALAAAFYVAASIIPVFAHDCPYYTWLTPVIGRLCWLVYTLIFILSNLVRERSRLHNRNQKMDFSIFIALFKGVSRYTYELFDSEVDWVFMKDLPHDLKTHDLVSRWLRGRSTNWDSFMNGSRLAFVWERMSGYLLLDPKENKDAIGALLDHLPRQMPDTDIKSVSAFIVHLRRRERFMNPLVDRMSEVNSAATAVGSLKLLQVLIDAHSSDASMYDYLGNHWKTMDDTVAKDFTRILEQICSVHRSVLYGVGKEHAPSSPTGTARGGDLSVLIAVTKLRRTLLRKRDELLRAEFTLRDDTERRTPPNIDKIKPLDKMLLCLEQVQDFRLLPLLERHANDNGATSGATRALEIAPSPGDSPGIARLREDLDRYDPALGPKLTAQNMLTLVAYLIWFELQAADKAQQSHSTLAGTSYPAMFEFDDTSRDENLSHLLGWIEKNADENKMIACTSDQQLSAVFMRLSGICTDMLNLRAKTSQGQTQFELDELRQNQGGRKAIRNLFNHILRRVPHLRLPTANPSTNHGSSAVDRVAESLKMLAEFCIFSPAHREPPRAAVAPQRISLTLPQLKALGLGFGVRQKSHVPVTKDPAMRPNEARTDDALRNPTIRQDHDAPGQSRGDGTITLPDVYVTLTNAEMNELGIELSVRRELDIKIESEELRADDGQGTVDDGLANTRSPHLEPAAAHLASTTLQGDGPMSELFGKRAAA
ncbi:unnamed protein product [Peniophora sp. CBMAI 1063]|nr:unnamed protein product [Peniophora sp. CBMAI 1063]